MLQSNFIMADLHLSIDLTALASSQYGRLIDTVASKSNISISKLMGHLLFRRIYGENYEREMRS